MSCNWDLILDQLLIEDDLTSPSYGLRKTLGGGPVLLKPHGSLNWYEKSPVEPVFADKRVEIFSSKEDNGCIEAFLPPCGIKSKAWRRYTALIVPPTYLKDFNRPLLRIPIKCGTHSGRKPATCSD